MKPKSIRPLGLTLVQRKTEADFPSARALYQDSFVAALHRQGLPTTLLTPRTKTVLTFPRGAGGVGGSRGILVSPRFLVDLVRSRAPFVLCHEYGVETFLALMVARIVRQHALVFQEHVGRAGMPMSRVDTLYRRLIGRLADGFVANTAAARDEIVRLLRVDPEKVFTIMTIVPPEREELCREPLGIEPPRSRPLFLYLGRLIALKNVETMLAAANLLREEGHAFEVWIGGEGPEDQRLRDMTAQLGLDDVVRFIGPIAYRSIGYVYEASDVFVMPSNKDYRNVAVLEAMRFGKPVIDSALDGNAHDTARDRINALIFDPANPSQLADCMREFILTPGLAHEMGARAAAMMERHTPDSAALVLIAVLTEMRPPGD